MKRLLLLFTLISSVSFGQVSHLYQQKSNGNNPEATKPTTNSEMLEKATVVWSNTCNNVGDWTLTNTSVGPTLDWYWVNTPDFSSELATLGGVTGLIPFASTTADDGFLIVNSDGAPGNADQNGSPIVAEASITVNTAMPAGINVLLRFQHNFIWWQDIRGVRVSGDGGTTFPIDTLFSDATGSLLPSGQISGNPEISVVDISSVAMGAAAGDVVIQFYYDDQDFWGWYWVVDDVEIIEKPDNDVQVLGAYFSGVGSGGIEWGRTPLNHVDPAGYYVGAEVYNFGASAQTNVTLDAQYSGASPFTNTPANTVIATLAPGATDYPESTESPTLTVGMYNGTYVVETDGEQAGGPEFGDNTYQKNWEITNNDIYSLDGIGNHPAGMEILGSVGTANFTDGADGITVCSGYKLQSSDYVSGVRVMLSGSTVDGGEMFVSIHDTASWWAGTINPLFSGAGSYVVTAADVTNGYADVLLSSPANLAAGTYYMCVELYSNGNASDIQILDDQTVPQPYYASTIYIAQAANPGPYSNGNAVAIRALMGFDCANTNITGTDTRTECAPYTWIDGNVYTQSNNTATYNIVGGAANGCDSLVTLNLTIAPQPNLYVDFWGASPNPVECGDTSNIYLDVYNNWNYINPNDPDLDITISIGNYITQGTTTGQGTSLIAPYTIDVSYTDACGNTASTQFYTEVLVNTDYNVMFTANPTGGTSPMLVVFDNQTPNLGNYNFTWYFGDGTSEQNNSSFVTHTYAVDGLWDVTLIAEHPGGCTDTLYYEDYIFTTGGVSCTHTASINQTGPLSFCQGDSVLLTCNNSSVFTYQWNLNGAMINGATNDSLYVTQSGNYSVTIYENNCPVVSNNISVTVNTLPNPIISSFGVIVPCSGGSVTMDAGSGYLSYDWSSGGVGQFETTTTSGNYTVTVLGSNGCYGTSAPYVVSGSYLPVQEVCIVGIDSASNFNRVIWEKPIIAGIDSFYVYRESTVANVYEKIGAVDYNDTALFIDQNSNPSVQAYRYKLSSLDTCGSETPLGDFHKTIHLTINQGVGQTWNLIWSHYEGFAFGSYNIYRGTDPNNMVFLTTIASNLNSYTDLTPPGGLGIYYQIEVVSSTPCNPLKANYNDSRSNIAAVSEVGIETLDDLTAVSIYPNPTNSVLNIELKGDFEYSLIDSRGRLLMTEKGNDKVICDISEYESGVYLVTVNSSAGSITRRIVKK